MDTPIRSILHPTDLSEASGVAFLHALKLALSVRGKLTLLHVVDDDAETEWADLPGVRDTLARWGLLAADAPREDVGLLGLSVRKVIAEHNDPLKACLHHLEDHPADMIVLATSQRQGRARWLGAEVSAPLGREAGLPALFVPHGVPGFVDASTGDLRLDRVLMPIAPEPSPADAIEQGHELLNALGFIGQVTALHVGAPGAMGHVALPAGNGFHWQLKDAEGEVVPTILGQAKEQRSDLLIMPTAGRHGFLDALRGSTTEQVLREAHCPVLALPA